MTRSMMYLSKDADKAGSIGHGVRSNQVVVNGLNKRRRSLLDALCPEHSNAEVGVQGNTVLE